MSSKNIKISVANLAAQMIMEEGIEDYLFAKKKAAKSLGLNENMSLPSNSQIDNAIKDFNKIFNQDVDIEFLEHFKTQALNVMSMFKNFRPHLMNQLSEGIIPKFPEIKINLFTDNLKDIEYIILNSEISYEFREVKMNSKVGGNSIKSIPTFYLDNLPIPAEIKVYFENDFFNFKKNFLQNRGLNFNNVLSLDINALISSNELPLMQNK
ncbi:MAG: hypothetical protein HOF25_03625 [Nitrosomonadales bacterium]|jgi:hypothetical protein|nr:hypothetical protein [Nitrosomonadales bacterium]MBT4183028.1 hypothetical protein [Nitrosomonadales bacterium]MBT4759328.1 hypothetical protein [Nitrosomonadales bacterium]MBT5150666.1 hypothetical protein [Nitrosomonadales bacterium]MBT6817920.1 hypothetical protein [Nitrosomonadales bacterium]